MPSEADVKDQKSEFEIEFEKRAAEREARNAGITAPVTETSAADAKAAEDAAAKKAADEAAEKAKADADKKSAEEKVAAEAKAKEEAAKKAAEEPAWITALPEEHRAAARATLAAAAQRDKENAEKLARMGGQVNGLQKKYDGLLAQTRAKPADSKPANTGKPDDNTGKKPAESPDMAKFAEQFPEIHAAMEARMQDVRAKVDEAISKIDPIAKDAEQQRIQAGAAAIEAAHPGWEALAASEEFKGWFKTQPESLRALANSENAEDTIMVLDFFKAKHPEKGSSNTGQPADDAASKAAADKAAADALAAKRKQQLDDSVGAQGRQQSTATASPPEDFEAAFNFYARQREQREARASR